MAKKTAKKKSPVTIIREQNKIIRNYEEKFRSMYSPREVEDIKTKHVKEMADIREKAQREVNRGNYSNGYAEGFKEAVDIMLGGKDLVLRKQDFRERNIEISNDGYEKMIKGY